MTRTLTIRWSLPVLLAALTSGCVAYTVVDTTVGVVSTAVETTVDVAAGAVDLAVGDDDEDE